MRKRLLIYCEGQTEEMFVERLLRPHLQMHGIKVERPILAATSQDPRGQRGGFVNWNAIEFDLRQQFASDHDPHLRFTTLLDVFRIPNTVPGAASLSLPLTAVADIDVLEKSIEAAFNEPRFKAYLQRHELEALLLADIAALESVFHRDKPGIQQLAKDIAAFANAEEINHGQTTHPAARLASAIVGYENLKASNAYFVLAEAGLGAVRPRCPRFDAWMTRWENWGTQP
ncbi:MAG: DUF4276 family protein [Verrucomicrobia bacterium]|nr:DUF4276 family protein [Verrucomicrobiota bacterium]